MDGNGKVDLLMEEILQDWVEWVVLLGGMERGKFLPSISSLIGFRSMKVLRWG